MSFYKEVQCRFQMIFQTVSWTLKTVISNSFVFFIEFNIFYLTSTLEVYLINIFKLKSILIRDQNLVRDNLKF